MTIQPTWAYIYSAVQNGHLSSMQDFTTTLGLKPEVAQETVRTLIQKGVLQDTGGTFTISHNGDQTLVEQLNQFWTTTRQPA